MTLTSELKGQFRNIVNSRCGLYFKDYDLKDLESAIFQRMKAAGIDTPVAYYNILAFSDSREDEFRELLNILTVKHTYFFRNEPQFKVLKEKILPEIVSRKIGQPVAAADQSAKPMVRIWSAGCATGEEPYSIAMTMLEAIPDVESWDIQIMATDASTDALAYARQGLYGANSMRLVADERRKKYFTEERKGSAPAEYRIRDNVRKLVQFSFFNLMDEEYPGGFDVIFCRNVVIYFDLETTIRVMNRFGDSLNDSGYLFIGYSESLQFISEIFKMVDYEDAIFYMKAGKDELPERSSARERFAKSREGVSKKELDKVLEEISKAEFESDRKEELARKKRSARSEELLIQAIKASHLKKYEDALSLIEEARLIDQDSVEPYYLAAEIYANKGSSSEAREALNVALSKNVLFAPAHYLFGSLAIAEGDMQGAQKSFKKALYLDSEFLLAHFNMANIYRDNGSVREAIREYRNTLNILSKNNLYDIIPYSGGFNVATLTGVCKNNIERLKVEE